MKTLLLVSNGSFMTENEAILLDKPISKMSLAWITTASKGAYDLSYIDYRRKEMDKLGFNYEEIDIEGMKKQELFEILAKKDAVFVEGGNSFYLLKAVRKSGFDEVIKELAVKGLIYIGSSAGAYIATPSIEGSKWINKNNFDMSYVSDYSGMKLVPFMMFVHYNKYSESEKKIINKKIKESKIEVKILEDYQCLLVQDDKVRFIGL